MIKLHNEEKSPSFQEIVHHAREAQIIKENQTMAWFWTTGVNYWAVKPSWSTVTTVTWKLPDLPDSKDSAGEETLSPEGPRQLITAAEQGAEFHGRVGSLCSPTPSHGDSVKQAQKNATRLMGLYTASRVEPGRCWSPVRVAIKPAPLSFQVETLASLPWKTLGRKGRSVQLHYARLAALERSPSLRTNLPSKDGDAISRLQDCEATIPEQCCCCPLLSRCFWCRNLRMTSQGRQEAACGLGAGCLLLCVVLEELAWWRKC